MLQRSLSQVASPYWASGIDQCGSHRYLLQEVEDMRTHLATVMLTRNYCIRYCRLQISCDNKHGCFVVGDIFIRAFPIPLNVPSTPPTPPCLAFPLLYRSLRSRTILFLPRTGFDPAIGSDILHSLGTGMGVKVTWQPNEICPQMEWFFFLEVKPVCCSVFKELRNKQELVLYPL